jgi:hypothetical protein
MFGFVVAWQELHDAMTGCPWKFVSPVATFGVPAGRLTTTGCNVASVEVLPPGESPLAVSAPAAPHAAARNQHHQKPEFPILFTCDAELRDFIPFRSLARNAG